MPCLDGREHVWDEHAYKGSQILCSILKRLERRYGPIDIAWTGCDCLGPMTKEIVQWWKEHKRIDAEG